MNRSTANRPRRGIHKAALWLLIEAALIGATVAGWAAVGTQLGKP